MSREASARSLPENDRPTGYLSAVQLSHRFPNGAFGLCDVTVHFPFEELVVVTGLNGAGKSLLARHLVGLIRPTSGRILLNGTDIRRVEGGLHQHVGMVFQDAEHQIIGQTVREDLAFGPIHHGMTNNEAVARVARMMQQVGLQDRGDADPHTLSGGELRRLAVAGVVITGARYVILDEPFSSLDPPGVRDVLNAILRLRREGCGIMVITHELEKVLAHADRLVILHQGRIEADSGPEAVLEELSRFGLRRPPGPLKDMTWRE